MENFNYYTPTKVVFGKETEQQTGQLVRECGCRKVLVHYGSGSVKKSGLLDRICRSLDETGVDYVTLGGDRAVQKGKRRLYPCGGRGQRH